MRTKNSTDIQTSFLLRLIIAAVTSPRETFDGLKLTQKCLEIKEYNSQALDRISQLLCSACSRVTDSFLFHFFEIGINNIVV